MKLIATLFTDKFIELLKDFNPEQISFIELLLNSHYAGDETAYDALNNFRDELYTISEIAQET